MKESDFGGADYVIRDYGKITDQVREITQGKMADVVLNSLGIETWDMSYTSVGTNGRSVSQSRQSKELNVKVWKKFKLDDVKEAIEALPAKERDGRILLDIT
jgi:NADPH:quinone reductase-like Zn-dependent oxidoreductase